MRLVVRVLVRITVAGAVALAAPTSSAVLGAPCWRAPVSATVVDPFRAPACRWCAGNRGIEYRTTPGRQVRTVAAGRVTFSGSVAGTRYVVVQIAGGWRLTYGRLASVSVRRGDTVAARTVVGTTGRRLFFGLRVGGTYRDPARYLGQWVGRPRLVPLDGAHRRTSPLRWRCSG
ncbi:MAG: M23 family metallopeptidase [Ilumatobacter sp.]|nr:M23 family metallopeptidase [Ilumatobacter sp.]